MTNNNMLQTEFIRAEDKDSKQLMVVLHGVGDSVAGFRWLPSLLELPRMNYLLVNAPDPYYGGYSWYDFAGDKGVGIRRSRKLLFELLEGQRQDGFAIEQTV